MKLSAVVVAAGMSKRMGPSNKMLLPFANRTVIETTLRNLLKTTIDEIVVVTGQDSQQVIATVEQLDQRIITVENKQYHTGLTSSIQAGVHSVSNEVDGYMICLGDMPLITSFVYQELADFSIQMIKVDPKSICVLTYNGKRGNPIVFSSDFREPILNHQAPEGCKEIVLENKSHVKILEVSQREILIDMDTPEDYQQLLSIATNNK